MTLVLVEAAKNTRNVVLINKNEVDSKSNQPHFYIPKGIPNVKNTINNIVQDTKNAIEYGNINFIISPNVYSGLYFFINTRIIPAYDINGEIVFVDESAILYAAETISGVKALFT